VQLEGGRIQRLPLDDYVRGTVAAEMWVPPDEDPSVAERIFEVQALVARTYAVANLGRHAADGFDLCSTTHCQVYRQHAASAAGNTPRWAEAIDDSVARTPGQVILFDEAPILALFHANCGGATSAADAIWGGIVRPYLTSVADGDMCARAPGATWRTPLTRDAITRALDADARTAVGGRLDSIDIVQTDAAGRALLVALSGARSPVVRGEELRLVLVRAFGSRSVRSPRFTIRRDGETFVFEGKGIGHGAGLCQFGAMTRLRAGGSPASIIAHYYPGATIGRWRAPRHT
jgi:stage II sporulation protein D